MCRAQNPIRNNYYYKARCTYEATVENVQKKQTADGLPTVDTIHMTYYYTIWNIEYWHGKPYPRPRCVTYLINNALGLFFVLMKRYPRSKKKKKKSFYPNKLLISNRNYTKKKKQNRPSQTALKTCRLLI